MRKMILKRSFMLIMAIAFALVMFLPVQAQAAEISAASTSHHIVYADDDIVIEEILIVYDTDGEAASRAASTKTASKTYNIKNELDRVVATYTLYGTFSYNGASAACTSASHSTNIINQLWKISLAVSSRSNSKAVGNFAVDCALSDHHVSGSLTISCDRYGNIT